MFEDFYYFIIILNNIFIIFIGFRDILIKFKKVASPNIQVIITLLML